MKQQHLINNFLESIDLNLPVKVYLKRVMVESKTQKWEEKTFLAIMEGIKKIYGLEND
jgi:hypothetical protein